MADPLWTIDATLKHQGFTLERPMATYRGQILAHGKPATVEIDIPDVRFVTPPTVRLVDGSALPVPELAHLMTNGHICYVGEGGLPLDLYNPGGSVLRVLAEASATLERSFSGGAKADFEQELSAYWKGSSIYCAIARVKVPAIVQAEMILLDGIRTPVLVAKGAWAHCRPQSRVPTIVLAFATQLQHTTTFPLGSLAAVLDYIAAQPNPPNGWREAVLAATASSRPVFLAAPNAIIGWTPQFPPSLELIRSAKAGFRPAFFRKMVDKQTQELGLDRMTGTETDLRFCVERNLVGEPTLIGKKIAIVGCGTIGSNLAKMLVQAGAGCDHPLWLYDTDRLSPGNLGRHLLGFSDLGKPKADAVADYLHGFHPDVQIEPKGIDASQDWAALETCDLVIDATGDPNVASALNDLWLKSDRTGDQLALLHCWVFGNGIASQTFLNLKDADLACYRCLRTGFDGQWRYSPLKDANSPLRMAPARCGEAGYIPFAVDAPVAAASLALRTALDWAGGKPGLRLRTVVLNHTEGREAMKWVSPTRFDQCVACGG
ncbi:ThiF family adenylyltransferase [Sphingobium baderi]|uniref:ThiF family adenylyltransferase n=1 Tax=Sphingobium baderi TaxID=1332080 RepID=UPI002B4062F3|nr:ThiF family adenylyltransferase [Sphingobium baderi]WRD78855.1 ThiF family adenylyltransferase [Sphingobium baderi]